MRSALSVDGLSSILMMVAELELNSMPLTQTLPKAVIVP